MAPALIPLSSSANSEELKVGLREFPAGRGNPFQGCVCSPAIFVWSSTYEQLARVGDDGRPIPVLAESWEASGDTWRFKLRPGVKFSNGEPLNAEAVKATFDFLATDKGKTFSQSRTLGVFIAETTVIDELTVEVRTPKPDPVFVKIWAPRALRTRPLAPAPMS
jgi:ABC-type transport system substrate-binding protein